VTRAGRASGTPCHAAPKDDGVLFGRHFRIAVTMR
jgi:hypothetical protein